MSPQVSLDHPEEMGALPGPSGREQCFGFQGVSRPGLWIVLGLHGSVMADIGAAA